MPPKKQLPSKEQLLAYIREAAVPPTKRELAKAFGVRGDDRVLLKEMIRQLQVEQHLPGGRKRPKPERKATPGITELTVKGYTSAGQLQAAAEDGMVYNLTVRDLEDTPTPGVRVLVKLRETDKSAILLKILPDRLSHLLGIFHSEGAHGIVEPVSKKIRDSFSVHADHTAGAGDGELVYCRILQDAPKKGRSHKILRQPVEVLERIGRLDAPRSASLIAIHNQQIPMEFSPDAVRIATQARAPTLTPGREDLRDIPLVTIDGPDARDFDDAVWAERDGDAWHLVVAIADVAHYVRFGTALDNEAFERGNSVYFPDRVVPMLPEALSNGLCSLNPDEDRYCLAVHLWINDKGDTTRYQFVRGLMRSRARLTYEQVQAAYDGEESVVKPEIVEHIIKPLYGVYEALNHNRTIRGALELDLPEHKATIDPESGKVTDIHMRERFDSHKLIEECMIAANVAAAHAIETADAPGMFRVHEAPDYERIIDLRGLLKLMGYTIARQENLSAHHFNTVLLQAKDTPEAHVIHMAILRSQTAAYYHPKNLGHFGLSLEQYCHFTSPIRRYSDLIVHRTLIDIFNMVDRESDGLVFEQAENLSSISTHISQTERRAMLAEREANDRYVTSFMADQVGKEFGAVIASVNSFGFFVELRENGAQGLVPLRSLGNDYYLYDRENSRLVGRRSGETFSLGQRVRVMLMQADTLTGSLTFSLSGRELRGGKPSHPIRRERQKQSHPPAKTAHKGRKKGKR